MIQTSTYPFTRTSLLFFWIALLSVLQKVSAQVLIATNLKPPSSTVLL